MKKMIVTADDYGMSKAVNQAIDEGIEAGLITATNVMTNMPYYKEAGKLRGQDISLGIHWTLSCGQPVLPGEKIPSLVDPEGNFYAYPVFRERFRKGLIENREICLELKAQYKRFVKVAGQPDYWNTHENVHVDFQIFFLFVSVAKRLGILSMRSHERIYVPALGKEDRRSLKWQLMEPLKSNLLHQWQKKAHKEGMISPHGRICCMNQSDIHNLGYLLPNIKWKKRQVAEMVIHPATHMDSPYFGDMVDNRMTEYQLYTDPGLKELLDRVGIELCHYGDLKWIEKG